MSGSVSRAVSRMLSRWSNAASMFAALVVVLLCVCSIPALAAAASFATAPYTTFRTGTFPMTTLAVDLDHDGRVDLVTSNRVGQSISFLRGRGDGTFDPPIDSPTVQSPLSVALGDLDGDGKLDAVTTNSSATISVLHGHGDGTFGAATSYATVATGQNSKSWVELGDLNGDGRLDVATPNQGNSIAVFLGNGDGTLGSRTDVALSSISDEVVIADVNLDGRPDLVARATGGFRVLLGNGDGTFNSMAPVDSLAHARRFAIGDLNGDGRPDIVIGIVNNIVLIGAPTSFAVMLGNGDGTFGAATQYSAGKGTDFISLADLDGDGPLDVVFGSQADPTCCFVVIFHGVGDGTFTRVGDYAAPNLNFTIAIASFHGDGKLDIAMEDGFEGVVGILRGNGDGSFGHARTFPAPGGRRGVYPIIAAGDVNGDGRMDLATESSYPDTLRVLLGDGVGGFGAPIVTPGGGDPNFFQLADVNGDGRADLISPAPPEVSVPVDSVVSVYLSRGDGTFDSPTAWGTGIGPAQVVALDLNGDGKLDLATADRGDSFGPAGHTLSVLFGNGDGTFQPRLAYEVGLRPSSIVTSDFNRDGHLDLAVLCDTSATISVLLGNGDGSLAPPVVVAAAPYLYVFGSGDLNGDGIPDLVFTHGQVNVGGQVITVTVLLGIGDGSFTMPLDFLGDYGILEVTDVDGDGRADLLMNERSIIDVFAGNGDGTFAPGGLGWGVGDSPYNFAVADLNSDGLPDIATDNWGSQTISVVLNSTTQQPTPTLASLESASAEPGRVTIKWYSSLAAGAEAEVWRSENGIAWAPFSRVCFDGSGLASFVDASVRAGNRYGYRLMIATGGTSRIADEEWLAVPSATRLALAGASPNPSRVGLKVAFSLASASPATLELIDISGRRVRSRAVGLLGAGEHRMDLSEGAPLKAGLYFVRLVQGGQKLVARATVLD